MFVDLLLVSFDLIDFRWSIAVVCFDLFACLDCSFWWFTLLLWMVFVLYIACNVGCVLADYCDGVLILCLLFGWMWLIVLLDV